MHDADFPSFSTMLEDVAAFYPQAKAPTPGQKAMYFRALRDADLSQVRSAFDAHMRDTRAQGGWMPLPSHILAQIDGAVADDGRPGADEAWALALCARDEADTVIWTAEMAHAWSTCRTVFDLGDEVGARMAFRETYNRLVMQSRSQRTAPEWTVSLGFDPQRRDAALTSAVKAGRLQQSELPQIASLSVPLLLASQTVCDGIPSAARNAIEKLRQMFVSRAAQPSTDVLEKARTKQLQAVSAARVQFYKGVE